MPQSIFERLEKLVDEIDGTTKTAAEEPQGNGALGSDSQSVTKNVADALSPTAAKEGDRAHEMSTEVKNMGAASIDGAPDAAFTKAEDRVLDIGLKATGVGNDPRQEDDYGGTLKEPGVGTSTDAKFSDGNKYAELNVFMAKSAADRSQYCAQLANSILGDIALSAVTPTKTAAAAPAAPAATDTATGNAAAEELIKEANAGYDLARVLGMEKLSSVQRGALTIAETMRDAVLDASLVIAELQKTAAEEMGAAGESAEEKKEPPDGDGDADDASASPAVGGASPGEAAGSGEAGVPSDAEITKALDSVAGAGAGGPPPAPGAPPMPGADPAAAGGAPGAPGAPGDVGRDELLQQLLMAMQELGVTPDELAALAGGAPGAQGMQAQKIAAATKAFQRSGKFQLGQDTTKRARAVRDYAKEMLLELMPRA